MAQQHSFLDWIAISVGAFLVGFFFGLIPLVSGIIRNRSGIGGFGFVSCILGGLAYGFLLAAPLAVTFTTMLFLIRPGTPRRAKPEDKLDEALKQMEREVKRRR